MGPPQTGARMLQQKLKPSHLSNHLGGAQLFDGKQCWASAPKTDITVKIDISKLSWKILTQSLKQFAQISIV